MNIRNFLLHALMVVILAVVMGSQGCTVTFKGDKIELEGKTAVAYQLVDIGFTDGSHR